MIKPERVPGGWQVGDQFFRGRTARERAYRFAASQPDQTKKVKKKKASPDTKTATKTANSKASKKASE